MRQKALVTGFLVAMSLSLVSMDAFAKEWRTCISGRCSQTQATFATLSECARFQSHTGWDAKCFSVDGAVSPSFRTCVPRQCSQKQETFSSSQECIDYANYMGSEWSKCFDPRFAP